MQADLRRLKEKVDAGAEYVVTQMFFDNQKYFEFVEAARAMGIEVPIIPGLKIITQKRHLSSLPKSFSITIPSDLSSAVEEAEPKHVLDVGVEWALAQTTELIERGVPSVHFYVMQYTKAIKKLMSRLDV